MSSERIFVSHSHKDEEITQRVVEDSHRAGAEVWVDVAGLSHGNFMQHIDEALARCAWMVLVLTPSAIASQYVADEVYSALHRIKQGHMRDVIPILAAPCAPGAIPPQWDVLQRYDATRDYAAAIAGVLRAIGLPSAADESGPTAPSHSEETLASLLAQGDTHVAQKEWAQATISYQRATKLDATSFLAWANFGRTLDEMKRYAEGLIACNRALALDDQKQWVWHNKGVALHCLKRYEEALAAYDKALALDPKYVASWSSKGSCLSDLGKHEEALAVYEQALTLDPNYSFAWNSKGWTLHSIKHDEEALDAYECALAADPKYAQAWTNKATSLRALGRESEAIEADRHAKELEG
ncbi:MAG: toll/interleukin-1 receptor domain-containing protein [Ktedonobacterales bacterium]